MRRVFVGVALSVALAGVYACSHSHDDDDHSHDDAGAHTSPYPSCNAIAQHCHQYDVGEGPIHDCHELAHGAKSDEPCAKQKDQCLEICVPDAGAGEGGASDAGND